VKPEGKRPPVRPRLDGRIILKWIFRMCEEGTWTKITKPRPNSTFTWELKTALNSSIRII
jgi:hypothetical protein